MPQLLCSVCHQPFESERSPAMPFCSEKCRLIDFNRWLEEGYSMPVERDQELERYRQDEDGED